MQWIDRTVSIVVLLFLLLIVPVRAVSLLQTGGQTYYVQLNDSYWKLAEKYFGDGNRYPQIIAATAARRATDPSFADIENPTSLQPGWKLWVPEAEIPASAVTPVIAASPLETPGSQAAEDTLAGTGEPTGRIAFAFYDPARSGQIFEINIINPDGSGRYIFPVENVSEPALSTDGTRIAFRSWGTYENLRSLAVANIDGSEIQAIGGFWEDALPVWCSDDRRLVFASQREGDRRWRLYVVNPDGSNEHTLRRADGANLFGEEPTWSPDNQTIAYRGCDPTGNRCGLWAMSEDGVIFNLLIEDSQAATPAWSPLGDKIAFMSARSGNWDIYTIKVDGTGLTKVTSEPSIDGLPAWSPDGRWLAFLSDRGGDWGIYIVRSDGSDSRQVFAFNGGNFSPPAQDVFESYSWINERISWAMSSQ
jgi:Tol biopolymer transport system component